MHCQQNLCIPTTYYIQILLVVTSVQVLPKVPPNGTIGNRDNTKLWRTNTDLIHVTQNGPEITTPKVANRVPRRPTDQNMARQIRSEG